MDVTMNNKKQSIEMLRDIFRRWEKLLAGMSEEQITNPQLPSGLSIKDEVAHLWAWQQRSVARMEAFLQNRAPEYPRWPEALNPDSEEDLDPINAWIYETSRDKPWERVYGDWRAQFVQFLKLVEEVREEDLLAPPRAAWMEGYPLSATLEGTYEHHEEHLDDLTARLREDGGKDA
jgi:hypothetical protein